jgi:aminopeptidase N
MNDYLKTYEYQNAEAHQLRLSFEKVSGKDLNWFFNQWYFGSGNPKIKYSYTFEPVKKQVAVTISRLRISHSSFLWQSMCMIMENRKDIMFG